MDDEARRLNDCRIGAADDLYDALKGLVGAEDASVSLMIQRERWEDRYVAARAALARADGRT